MPQRASTRMRLLWALKLAASCVLMWAIFRRFDLAQIAQQIAGASPMPLVVAMLLCAASVWTVTLRWLIVLRLGGHAASYNRLVSHQFVGFFFAQAVLSTVGDGIRAWLVYRDGVPAGAAVRSVLIERLIGLGVLVVLAAAGLPFLLRATLPGTDVWWIEGAIALLVALGILTIWLLQRASWPMRFRLGREVVAVAADLWLVMRHPAALIGTIVASLFGQVSGCAMVWLGAMAVGADVPFVQTLVVMPAVFVLTALPISIAGWGVRESAVVFGLGLFGVPAMDAALVSVLYGLMSLGIGIFGGVIWLLQRGRPTPV